DGLLDVAIARLGGDGIGRAAALVFGGFVGLGAQRFGVVRGPTATVGVVVSCRVRGGIATGAGSAVGGGGAALLASRRIGGVGRGDCTVAAREQEHNADGERRQMCLCPSHCASPTISVNCPTVNIQTCIFASFAPLVTCIRKIVSPCHPDEGRSVAVLSRPLRRDNGAIHWRRRRLRSRE